MGIFFTIPLYLQLVLGLDALQTGIKMLPVSITMFITSAIGSRLSAPVRGADDHPGRPGDHRRRRPRPAGHGQARPRRPRLRHLDGAPRRRDGAHRLAARQRGPVVGRRVGPGRGRRPAVHRAAARLLARRRPHRGDRAGRPDQHVRVDRSRPTSASAPRSRPRSGWPSRPGWTSSRPPRSRPPPRTAGLDEATTQALVDDYEAAQLQSLKAGPPRRGVHRLRLPRVHQGPAARGAVIGGRGAAGRGRRGGLTERQRRSPARRQGQLATAGSSGPPAGVAAASVGDPDLSSEIPIDSSQRRMFR